MATKEQIKKALKTLEEAAAAMPNGDRHICVLDRGWIFVGNLTETEPGRYTLSNVKNVRKWQQGGFGLLSKGARSAGATLDDGTPLRFTASALLFSVPVG